MQKENVAAMSAGNVPKPQDRLKAGIKVDRSKFKSIKDYKASFNKKISYDSLTTQKEGYWDDRNAKQKETLAKHEKRMIDSAKKSVKKNPSPVPIKEDERYDPTPGGMEWGTPQGTAYFKSLTPGEGKVSKPLKTLPIKARRPQDEIGTKITEKLLNKKKKLISPHMGDMDPLHQDAPVVKGYNETFDLMRYADPENFVGYDHIEPNQANHSKHEYPVNNEKETHDTGDEGHWLTGKDGEWYIEQIDVDELDKAADNFTFKDALNLGLYDEEELEDEDFDGDPNNDVAIHEVLSVQGRMKRRFNARRNKQKLKVARRIALRRGSTPDRLKRRATRGARLMVYKRLLRGRDRGSLPPAEKARVEKMITRFQPLVNRISIKLLPQMRKNEIKRLGSRGKAGATTSKKYKAAKAIRGAASQKAKRYKIKKPGKFKAPKAKAFKSRIKSGGPTIKKASKAYKAFSYSVG
jgi:hypothetical protein